MALGKLWNAFFGNRDEPAATSGVATIAAPASQRPAPAKTLPPTGGPVARPKAVARPNDVAPAAIATGAAPDRPAPPPRPASPKRNAWSKLIAGRTIGSILDLNVGDASRAESLLEAIVCASAPKPKYIAINRFELDDRSLSVLQFHQRIRRAGGQAVPIPDDLCDGLRHLSHTLGAVDLILLDDSVIAAGHPEIQRLIERVTHPDSLLLRQTDGGGWEAVAAPRSAGRSSAKAA